MAEKKEGLDGVSDWITAFLMFIIWSERALFSSNSEMRRPACPLKSAKAYRCTTIFGYIIPYELMLVISLVNLHR